MAPIPIYILSTKELVKKDTWTLYKVYFNNDPDPVFITVTDDPRVVARWVTRTTTSYKHARSDCRPIVGVGVEWRRNFRNGLFRWRDHKVDILQFFVGEDCLIFQIGRAIGKIPKELHEFLLDDHFKFAGVGIYRDADILWRDYGILFGVNNIVELRNLYVNKCEKVRPACYTSNNDYTIHDLTVMVLKRWYVRPAMTTMSKWDARILNHDQVEFACLDAYACSRIGRSLVRFTKSE